MVGAVSGKKDCEWPGCDKRISVEHWGCAEHWRILPLDLQRSIARDEPMARHRAQQWILATFGELEDEHDPAMWDRTVRMVRDRDAARAERRKAAT